MDRRFDTAILPAQADVSASQPAPPPVAIDEPRLVTDGSDAVSNHRWGGTPSDWWSAGYDLELGAPLGPRYSWEGLLRRDFERGIALVNQPDTSTRTVALGGTYLDLAGNPRTSVTLAPRAGPSCASAESFTLSRIESGDRPREGALVPPVPDGLGCGSMSHRL